MTKCLSETNGFIFLNPGNSMQSLCGSGPQGFRQLTKPILLLLCCLPTMLFTYRRTRGSVQQMNEVAWLCFTEPLHRKSWMAPVIVIMPEMVISGWWILNNLMYKMSKYVTNFYLLFCFLWMATLTLKYKWTALNWTPFQCTPLWESE